MDKQLRARAGSVVLCYAVSRWLHSGNLAATGMRIKTDV